jgi:hypothetical protein
MRLGIGATSGSRPKDFRMRLRPVNDVVIAFMPVPLPSPTGPAPGRMAASGNQTGAAETTPEKRRRGQDPDFGIPPVPNP